MLDYQANVVQKEKLVHQDVVVIWEKPENVELQETRDDLEKLVQKDHLDQMDKMEEKEVMETQDHKVLEDQWDHEELLVPQDLMDQSV